MSNPARARTENLTAAQLALLSTPQAIMAYANEKEYRKKLVLAKTPEAMHAILNSKGTLDMTPVGSFLLPRNLVADPQTLNKSADKMWATSPPGNASFRSRSEPAMQVLKRTFPLLPESPFRKVEWATRALVAKAMRGKMSVDGGTVNTIGRLAKAYPKVGSTVSEPPSKAEVRTAIINCGQSLDNAPKSVLKPFPILTTEMDQGLRINQKATSGFPALKNWAFNGVPELVLGIHKGMKVDLERAYKADKTYGVWNLIREWEQTQPWLVACMGKCKADCYSPEKVEQLMMRFYNALPRQATLLMQTATQVYEEQSRNLLEQVGGTSSQGLSLVRGGASDLIDALDIQIMMHGHAHTHVGDDTWVIVKVMKKIYMFSIDCSNFDITQHSEATAEIHAQMRDQLAKIDPIAAQVWYAYMRERLVVTVKNVAYQWKHGGPSGSPMQSKVNDVFMDVYCQRVLQDPLQVLDRDGLERYLIRLGKELHLDVRLEDYEVVEATSLREALEEVSFLFVGYRFYAENKHVYVYTDIARAMAQFPYPSLKWTQKRNEFEVNEAARMGSIVMNMGRPPQELKKFHDTMVANVVAYIDKAISEFGDVVDEKLIWAVQANPMGAEAQPSLVGLREALTRTDALWADTQNEPEMKGSSTFLTEWADQMDEQDAKEAAAKGFTVVTRPGASLRLSNLKQLRAQARRVSTKAFQLKNLGRQAPTQVWGPDKPKRSLDEAPLTMRGRGKTNRRDAQFYDEMSESYGSGDDRSEDGYGYHTE